MGSEDDVTENMACASLEGSLKPQQERPSKQFLIYHLLNRYVLPALRVFRQLGLGNTVLPTLQPYAMIAAA